MQVDLWCVGLLPEPSLLLLQSEKGADIMRSISNQNSDIFSECAIKRTGADSGVVTPASILLVGGLESLNTFVGLTFEFLEEDTELLRSGERFLVPDFDPIIGKFCPVIGMLRPPDLELLSSCMGL